MNAPTAFRAKLHLGSVLIAIAITAGVVPWVDASGLLFEAAYRTFDTRPNPRLMAKGDVNNDGDLDVVLAHSDGTVSVLLGDGIGSFGTSLGPFTAIAFPGSMASADLNGDGRLDLVVTSTAEDRVAVLLGAGDGTFGPSTLVTASYPSGVAVGELTGDGIPDLAVSSSAFSEVLVLPGLGDGTFGPPNSYPVSYNPGAIALGDLNEDGRLDIAVACFLDGQNDVAAVLLADGFSGFGDSQDYEVGSVPTALAISDLNHDGSKDLVVANYGQYSDYISNGGSVAVLIGSGMTGTFGPKVDYLGGRFPLSVSVADVDADGHMDVVAVEACCSTVATLLGHGDATFATPTHASVSSDPRAVEVLDLDGDSRLDAAVACGQPSNLTLLDGNGDGTFGSGRALAVGYRPGIAAVADLDGDGNLDVVTPDQNPSGISVLLGNGDATFEPRTSFATAWAPIIAAVGDLNGDGAPDVVTGNAALNGLPYNVSVLLGTGNGNFATHVDFATAVGDKNTHAIALSDLDRDGKLDLVVGSFLGSRNMLWVLTGNGDGTFGSQVEYIVGTLQAAIAVGDVNGDGWPDIVATHSPGNVSILVGAGDGTMTTPAVNLPVGSSLPTAVAIGDLNGDGKSDLAVTLTSGGAFVLAGNGDGTFAAPTPFATAPYPYAIAISDLNRDGIADLATADFAANLVSIRVGQGAGALGTRTGYGVGSNPVSIAIGDMDNDGQKDLVVANTGSNSVSLLINKGPDLTAVTPQPSPRHTSLEVSPTPTRGPVRISFVVPQTMGVRVTVVDVQGRIVKRLIDRDYSAGKHEVTWHADQDLRGFMPGVLFVRLEMPGGSYVRRMVMLR